MKNITPNNDYGMSTSENEQQTDSPNAQNTESEAAQEANSMFVSIKHPALTANEPETPLSITDYHTATVITRRNELLTGVWRPQHIGVLAVLGLVRSEKRGDVSLFYEPDVLEMFENRKIA